MRHSHLLVTTPSRPVVDYMLRLRVRRPLGRATIAAPTIRAAKTSPLTEMSYRPIGRREFEARSSLRPCASEASRSKAGHTAS